MCSGWWGGVRLASGARVLVVGVWIGGSGCNNLGGFFGLSCGQNIGQSVGRCCDRFGGVAVGRSFSLWACFGFYCGNTTTSQKYYVLGGRVELRLLHVFGSVPVARGGGVFESVAVVPGAIGGDCGRPRLAVGVRWTKRAPMVDNIKGPTHKPPPEALWIRR